MMGEREREDWGLLSISVLRGCVYTAVDNYDSHDHNYRIAELSSAQNIHVDFLAHKPYLDDCSSVCTRKEINMVYKCKGNRLTKQ